MKKWSLLVSILLLVQITAFYAMPREEHVPAAPEIKELPAQLGSWRMTAETEIETEVQEVLKADRTLNRSYAGPEALANLFVAFFRTQRAGVSPHSPKVCLPGAGWVPTESTVLHLDIAGSRKPIEVNRYVVSRGSQKSLVLYWYQSHNRTVALEHWAKLYTMVDSIRYRRSDVALVRVVIGVDDGGEEVAERRAVDFVRAFFQPLTQRLPA